MKEKLLYHSPEVSWSDLEAYEIICYSTDIDDYDVEHLEW